MFLIHSQNSRKSTEKFDYIYDKYYKYAYKIAFNVVQNSEDMKDVMQNIFIKVWNNMDKFTDDTSAKAWIATVAYSTAVDFCRVKGRYYDKIEDSDDVIEAVISIEDNNPESWIITRDSVERVYDEINKIKKKYADVLLLSIKYEMSPEQIARELNRNVKTVYTQLERGRQMLIAKLADNEGRVCDEESV